MLGVLSDDTASTNRLEDILNSIAPDIITVSYSRQYLEFEKQNRDKTEAFALNVIKESNLSQELSQSLIEDIQKLGEHSVVDICNYYSQKTGSKLIFVGNPENLDEQYKKSLTYVRDFLFDRITPGLIKELSPIMSLKKLYETIESLIGEEISSERLQAAINIFDREIIIKDVVYVSQRLIELSKQNPQKSILHIPYLIVDLLDDQNQRTLYSNIRHLNPIRETVLKYLQMTETNS